MKKMLAKKGFKISIGLILLGIGTITILPPPDLDLLIITGLTIAGVPIKYSVPSVYIGGFLLILVGCWISGKNLIRVLKLNKRGKNEKRAN
jgi:hypothetical protein